MLFHLPLVITRAKIIFFGPKPKFKRGDSVQCVATDDNSLMVVQWVKVLKTSIIMYSCKWYDAKAKSTRTNIFKEDQLKQFDWYHP